jgi:hypothetical protein
MRTIARQVLDLPIVRTPRRDRPEALEKSRGYRIKGLIVPKIAMGVGSHQRS